MLHTHPKFQRTTPIPIGNRLLKRTEVEEKTGLSRASIYSYVRAGTFPAPISIGANRVAWLESEIDEWIAEKMAARKTVSTQ